MGLLLLIVVVAAVALAVGLVALWRSTPPRDQVSAGDGPDRTKDLLVDASPPGGSSGV